MKLNWFVRYLISQKVYYIQAIVASVFINIFALASSLYIMVVYDRIIPNNAISSLISIAIGVVFIISMDFAMKMLRSYFLDRAGKEIEQSSSSEIFQKIINFDVSKTPKSSGVLISTVREFETVREFFNSASLALLVDIPFILLFLLVINAVAGPIVWIPATIVAVVFVFGLILQPFFKRISGATHEGQIAKQSVLGEMINGLETIKTISGSEILKKRWMESVNDQSSTGIRSRILSQLATNFAGMGVQASQLGIIGFGVLQIIDGSMSMGALIACVILSGRTLAPLAQIGGLFGRIHNATTAFKTVNQFMMQNSHEEDAEHFFPRTSLTGDIELSEVDFSYPGQAEALLKEINLKINAGEKVAILGRIGSGKTTILKLISGLYHVEKGGIFIDGANIKQLRPRDIRTQFGVVNQSTYLFSGSIRENISFGLDSVSEEEILEAARISTSDEFINFLPNGFDYQISEGGKELSGGQRQAICLARAIVRKPSVILLDEPTSAMDLTTEKKVISNLRDHFSNQTLILVTHRMSLLQLVDRVIALDKGKISVDGSRESILKKLRSGQSDE